MNRRRRPSNSPPPSRTEPVSAWDVRPRPPLRLPPAVEEAFEAYLKERFPKARGPRIASVVAELSEAYTSDRGSLPVSYLNQPPARSGYLAYFHPLQLLRGWAAVGETWERAAARGLWPRPEGRPLRVADLGAGLGAMSQAVLLASHTGGEPGPWPDFVLVDHQRAALQDARALVTGVAAALEPEREAPRVRTAAVMVREWLRRARKERWQQDVIVMGGVWNEWKGAWDRVLRDVLPVLAPGGIVIVVEPALAAVGRGLMELRDAFVADTTTIAPCAHSQACPLLPFPRDWCFTVRGAAFPKRAETLAQGLGHQAQEVRFALWSFAAAPPQAAAEPGLGRLVSDPLDGGQLVCTDGRRERLDPSCRTGERGDLADRR